MGSSSAQPQSTDQGAPALSPHAPGGRAQTFSLHIKARVMEKPHIPLQAAWRLIILEVNGAPPVSAPSASHFRWGHWLCDPKSLRLILPCRRA